MHIQAKVVYFKQTRLFARNLPQRKALATREKLHRPMAKFVNQYKVML